jgi:hypothetical protein
VSGFVLTGFVLALLTRPALSRRGFVGVGILLGLVGLVQPLWLSVTVPLLLIARREHREVVLASLVFLTIWLVPTGIALRSDAFWQPRVADSVTLRPGAMARGLTGAFSGAVAPHEPGAAATVIGVLGTLAFIALLLIMLADSIRKRSRVALALLAAMIVSVAHVAVLQVWVPRYFLPSTVLAVTAAAASIGQRSIRLRGGAALAATALVCLLAAAAVGLGRDSEPSRLADVPAQEDLLGLITGLEADQVRGVYAASSDVHWQILFYGGERIPVRGTSRTDRYPELARAVAAARRAGQAVTLVADVRQLRRDMPELGGFPGYRVGERYLRLDSPSVLERALLGFESDPEEAPER